MSFMNNPTVSFSFKLKLGLILVHDLTNKNSFSKLRNWIVEILRSLGGSQSFKWKVEDMELDLLEVELDTGETLPVLIVGCKEDLLNAKQRSQLFSEIEDQGGSSLYLVFRIYQEIHFRTPKTKRHSLLILIPLNESIRISQK